MTDLLGLRERLKVSFLANVDGMEEQVEKDIHTLESYLKTLSPAQQQAYEEKKSKNETLKVEIIVLFIVNLGNHESR